MGLELFAFGFSSLNFLGFGSSNFNYVKLQVIFSNDPRSALSQASSILLESTVT